MAETIWSVLPPLITIALALWTKEVYMSLLIGIISGALLYTEFAVVTAVETMFTIMGDKIGGNVNILIFLVLLGILVALVTKSGASRAYGEWAAKTISSKRSSLFATSFLGALIFVDDYFNCLTVGTVMRPVTDKFKVSRAKLAYVIDSTAAPVCIIAPVSTWAAAVGSSLPEGSTIDGFSLFLQTIPFNFYAILALLFMFFVIYTGNDFGAMAEYEKNYDPAKNIAEYADSELKIEGKGKILDLVLPLVVLIAACIAAMLYTGGFGEDVSLVDAFANCDSSKSLVLGAFAALVFTFFLYLLRGVINFAQFCASFSEGFKAMTSAIFILCLAWTLSGICNDQYLNIGGYVGKLVNDNAMIGMFLPAVFFLVAVGLAFASGTSWGTFGILIPIAISVLGGDSPLLVMTVAAILAGAVSGDHSSPISDTTILASAGAQCSHIDHVSTQIPYVVLVSSCCFAAYLVAGIMQNAWIGLLVGLALIAAAMVFITINAKKRTAKL